MGRRWRRRLKDAIIRSRIPFKGSLARSYLRAAERYRSIRGGRPLGAARDGHALPPSRLRVLVAGTADVEEFLSSGEAHAASIRELLVEVGRPLEQMDAILDFGCGCGRIARWFADLNEMQLAGCDYNGELVQWCAANLSFMRAQRTQLEPPLPYPDDSFDFVYAFSVFTHLSAGLAERWISEIRRVLRPGGLLWFTVHGQSYRERLLPEEKVSFDGGDIVVWLSETEGTNICGAFWPESAVDRLFGGRFDRLVHFDPIAEPETAERIRLAHDAYLLRRR